MRLESADHHRADPNRAQSRIRVQAESAPNHGDRTVRFPVVMAGSRVSLVSLGGTYSTALFAMMSTPKWRTDCDQGFLVGVQARAPDGSSPSSACLHWALNTDDRQPCVLPSPP